MGEVGEASLNPKLRVVQREYTVGGWREREKLHVRLMPKSDECSNAPSGQSQMSLCASMSQAREEGCADV